jgi:hypothetical protein
MSSVRRVLLTIAVGAALGAGPAIAAPAMAAPMKYRDLTAFLNGSRVVVQPGTTADADAWGAATVRVYAKGRVCYSVYTSKLGTGIDAKIYRGGNGDGNDDADVRATLDMFGSVGSGCEWIPKIVARQMMKTPGWYNLQVNSNTGSIRGQLRKSGNNW